ncbi:unnamed protein product [Trichobilharzia szidati]|nr:unnamed protein product [Trichobilharzia szidati]
MDQFIHLLDRILQCAQSDLITGHRSSSHRDVVNTVKSRSFHLAPAYAMYLTYRACIKKLNASNQFQPVERDHYISHLTNYMATRIYESVPNFNRNSNTDPTLIKPLTYWLGNSSELLHFFKNDIDLCSSNRSKGWDQKNDRSQTDGLPASSSSSMVCRDALHILAETVDHCFYYLRSVMTGILQPWLMCLTYPGDLDLQDDILLDDKPIDPTESWNKHKEPVSMQIILQYFTYLMQQLRKSRVNAALTFQLYSQLFHLIGAHIFNTVLIDTEAKPRNVLSDGNLWLTRLGASRLNRRLDRIKRWAHKQGLELAVECRLQRCTQACQLIMANRTNLDEFYQHCISLISLNSIQLEWLLAHLSDPPPVPDEWIDLIVTGAKEVNDRAYADEMEHYISTGQSDLPISELQLNELKELPIPLLLPADGYASDAVLTGIPDGLLDFLRPLIKDGLIKVKKHPITNGQLENRPWTNCMRLAMYEKEHDNRNQHVVQSRRQGTLPKSYQDRKSPSTTTTTVNLSCNNKSDRLKQRTHSHSGDHADDLSHSSNSLTSNTGSIDSSGSNFKEFSTQTVRYQPSKPSTLQKSFNPLLSANKETRTHASLPDLSHASYEQLAKDANVPIKSITQFFLKKYNNSLGLSIVAAKAEGQRLYGIYVKEIVPNGAADRDGRLKTGDQILAIGNTSLIGCAQSDAVAKISKQSKPDDGVQLVIAKKAAQFHKIIELIRPTNNHISSSNSMNNSGGNNHDKRSTQAENKKHDLRDMPYFNQSQPDLRIENQQNQPSTDNHLRSTIDHKKSNSTDHRPVSQRLRHQQHPQNPPPQQQQQQPKHNTNTRPNHPSVNKAKRLDQSRQKIGSLSRSTPSLNLAEIGMNDEASELEDHDGYKDDHQKSSKQHPSGKQHSSRSRTHFPEKINRPQSVDASRHRSQSRSTPSSPSSLSETTSSESDIIINNPEEEEENEHQRHQPIQHQEEEQQHQHGYNGGYRRTQTPTESLKQHKISKRSTASPSISSHLLPQENFHSQPNILKKAYLDNTDNYDKNSLVNSDGAAYPQYHQEKSLQPIIMAESISNDFTSLESVSSGQQTVCSLNESQPMTDDNHDKMPKSNSHETRRVRHQPPPPPPPPPPSTSSTAPPTNYSTKNEMLTTRKDAQGNWKPAWRETDLDRCNGQELNVDNHSNNNNNNGDINERNQRRLMHNNIDSVPSVDEIQEKHEISRNSSPTFFKNTNHNPTEQSIYLPRPFENTTSSRIINDQPVEETRQNNNTIATIGQYDSSNENHLKANNLSSSIASYHQNNSTTNSLMYEEEPASEALKPPSHAVVSINRWNEESMTMVSGPVVQTDLPNVHIDPQRGRISTKSYSTNQTTNPLNNNQPVQSYTSSTGYSSMSNDIIIPPTKSFVHQRISQFTNDYQDFDPPKLSTTTLAVTTTTTSVQKSTYLSSSSYSGVNMSYPDSRHVNGVYPMGKESSNPLLSQEAHNAQTYSKPINTPSYMPSPPPVPTAEYPQYHPPERLEPVHWSTYKHCSSNEERTSNYNINNSNSNINEKSSRNFMSPQPSSTNLPSSRLPFEQPIMNKPDSDNNYQPSLSKYSNRPIVHASSSPTGVGGSAASRVLALQSEIAELEAQQRVDSRLDLGPTLDRLHVELQFQKRLAERESNCKLSLNNTSRTSPAVVANDTKTYSLPEKSNTLESIHPHPSSMSVTNQPYRKDWIHKKQQAEQELLEKQNQRISQLEEEHRAMLIRQELRAKERSQWFERKQQHQQPQTHSPSNPSTLKMNSNDNAHDEYDDDDAKSWNYQTLSQVPLRQNSDDNLSQASSSQNRYGRPRFDAKQEMPKFVPYAMPHPIQSRLGPQVIESELSRLHSTTVPGTSTDGSMRVKKSVSFDKNLETISVYSPPTTPQDSLIENSSTNKVRNSSRTTTGQNLAVKIPPPSMPSYKKSLSPPIGFETVDDSRTNAAEKHSQQGRTTNSNTGIPRSASQGKIPHLNNNNNNNNMPNITVKPPPNAELLPFKEKMRLFAQQIGEGPPKERIKASSRQRELQTANNLN